MTTLSEAREAIYQAFVDGWGATSAYTFDNEVYTPTEDATSWVRLAVRHRGSGQSTLGKTGNRKFSRMGAVFVQIFTRVGSGMATADTLATTARGLFEGVSLAGTTIRFLNVMVREAGQEAEGKWVQTVVEAEFEYEEIR